MIGSRSLKLLIVPCAVLLVALAATAVPATATTPGAIDTSYGSSGVTVVPGAVSGATTVDSTGRALVLGLTSADGSTAQITRLTAAGQVDTSFNTSGTFTLPAGAFYARLTLDSAGLIYALGGDKAFGTTSSKLIVTRLTAAGAADSGFGTGGTATITVPPFISESLAVRNDGDIVISLTTSDATQKGYLAALTPAGALDTSFGGTGSTGVMPLPAKTFAVKVAAALAPVAPVFTADSPPTATTVGASYSYTFVATGLPAPTYAVASGALPSGLSLNAATGVLSGTPDTVADYTFTIAATNGTMPDAVSPSITIHVAPTPTAPAFTADTPPTSGVSGTSYGPYTFTATGQPAPTFALASGALPPGLTLNGTSGVLSGTPSGTGGTYTFAVKATNGVSPDAVSPSITVNITAAPHFTAVSPPTTANTGTAYSYTFAASGTPAPTFSVTSGSLPPGLSLSSAGVVSGAPTTPGSFSFQVTAANGVAPAAVSPTITINVASAPAAPVFTAASPPSSAKVGVAYSYTFMANGNPAPKFAAVGVLPAGLTLNATTGVLSGVPTTPHTYIFRVKASNGVAPDAYSAPITITVARATTAVLARALLAAAPSTPAPDPNQDVVAIVANDTGTSRTYSLQRFLSDGSLDPSFGTGGSTPTFPAGVVPATVVESGDGSYYVTGNSGQSVFLARVLTNGQFDAGFGTGGIVTGPADPSACTPTGAVLVLTGGNVYVIAINTTTSGTCGPSPAILLRFHSGALDSSFGAAGQMRIDSVGPMNVNGPNGGGAQPGGQVLVGLNGSAAGAGASAAVTRVNVAPVGPTVEQFTQLVDDSHYGAATVVPNPAGTYLGPVAATVAGADTHLYAEGGNHDLFEFLPVGSSWSAGTDLTATTAGAPSIVTAPKVVFDGSAIDVFALGTTGDLIQYRRDGTTGAWTTTDVNTAAGTLAPKVTAALNPQSISGVVHMYAATTAGDLVEIDNDNAGGHAWNFYDLTKSAGGGVTIASGPAALLIGPSPATPHVYTRAASNNHLVEYVADHAGGRVWNAYDVTVQAVGAPPIGGSPIPVLIAGTPHVYATSAATGATSGDLIEYVADHLSGQVWNAYDQTSGPTGAPKPVGNPSVVTISGTPYGLVNPIPEVWETAANGDVTNVVADHLGGRVWNVYDVTLLSGGPQVTGDPTPIVNGTTVQVFGLGIASPSGAAPVGAAPVASAPVASAGNRAGPAAPTRISVLPVLPN